MQDSCRQIIEARFLGCDDAGEPRLQLTVIDSSFWVVWSPEDEVLDRVRDAFVGVKDYDEPEPEARPSNAL